MQIGEQMTVEEHCEKCNSRQLKTVDCIEIVETYERRIYTCNTCLTIQPTWVEHRETHFDYLKRQKGGFKWH